LLPDQRRAGRLGCRLILAGAAAQGRRPGPAARQGILNLIGEDAPVAIHSVHHVFHPPVQLESWPDVDRRSRIVFVTRVIVLKNPARQLLEHVGAARA